MFRFITPVLLFVAWLLLLLCSVSAPVTVSIYLFDLFASASTSFFNSGVTGNVRFGLWGYCTSGFKETLFGISREQSPDCSQVKPGFTIDDRLVQLLKLRTLQNVVNASTTAAFVLHPVACGLAFLALISSLVLLFRPSRITTLVTLIMTLSAGILAIISFLMDVIFVSVTRNKIRDLSDNFDVTRGNIVWMALGATIALWLAAVPTCLNFFRMRRAQQGVKEKEAHQAPVNEKPATGLATA